MFCEAEIGKLSGLFGIASFFTLNCPLALSLSLFASWRRADGALGARSTLSPPTEHSPRCVELGNFKEQTGTDLAILLQAEPRAVAFFAVEYKMCDFPQRFPIINEKSEWQRPPVPRNPAPGAGLLSISPPPPGTTQKFSRKVRN